jgi:WD40 repeat protein
MEDKKRNYTVKQKEKRKICYIKYIYIFLLVLLIIKKKKKLIYSSFLQSDSKISLDTKTYIIAGNWMKLVEYGIETKLFKIEDAKDIGHINISRDESAILVIYRFYKESNSILIDSKTGKTISVFIDNTLHDSQAIYEYRAFSLFCSGNEVVICYEKTMKRYNFEGVCLTTYDAKYVSHCLFSGNNNRLYCSNDEKSITVFDYRSGHQIKCMARHEANITCLSWVNAEETFVSASLDKTVILWDATAMTFMRVIPSNSYFVVRSMVASPDGRYLFYYYGDEMPSLKIRQVCVDDKKEVYKYIDTEYGGTNMNDYDIGSLSLSRDGSNLSFIAYYNPCVKQVEIDPPFDIIVHSGDISTSTHAKQNFRLCSDGAILDFNTNTVFKVTPKSICKLICDLSFSINIIIDIKNKNIEEQTDRNLHLGFNADSPEKAKFWVESINAVSYHLSIPNEEVARKRSSDRSEMIITRYRFDQFQNVYQNSGPFGLRVPKTIVESIASYLLVN